MPTRRGNFGSRKPSRRTRWLSITPNVITMNTNDTYSAQQVVLQDATSTYELDDFVGGTLLKVFLMVESNPTVNFGTTFDAGYSTDHFGLFVTPDGTPDAAVWTPNRPSGDFMTRWSQSLQVFGFVDGADALMHERWANTAKGIGADPVHMAQAETNVARRITENAKLWLSTYHFEDAVMVTQIQHGYTGRVLLQLP